MGGRTPLLVLLGAAAAALLGACATATLDVHRPVPLPVAAVTLELRDATGGALSAEELDAFRDVVVTAVEDAGIAVVSPPAPGAARVRGIVTEYDEGIRLVRYLTPFGPGTGIVVTRWEIRDPAMHHVARCTIEGSVSTGSFGGSFDEVLEQSGQALARFLQGDIR